MPILWDENEEVVSAAARTLSVLLPRVPVMALVSFERELRESDQYWGYTGPLEKFPRPGWKRIKKAPESRWAFATLASERSGFVRENALEELRGDDSGDTLPFVLLRTNDWVEEVRTLARDIVRSKLGIIPPAQWERYLPLIFRMKASLRHFPAELFGEIEWLAASRPGIDHLAQYYGAPFTFLRYRIELGVKYGGLELERFIEQAATSPVAGLRILACDWCANFSDETVEKYASRLLADKSSRVRARAFWRIANRAPEKYQAQIERALMDKSAAVQDTARGAWKQLLHREALTFYREQAAKAAFPSQIVAALRGLRAEGGIADDALVRPLLAHPSGRVKAEALRTLASWDAPDTPGLLRNAALDASAYYSRTGGRMLAANPKWPAAAVAKELMLHPRHAASQNIAASLLHTMRKWSSLPLILLGYSIPEWRERAMEAYLNWNRNYNRVQSAPTKAEAAEALEAFRAITGTPLAKDRDLLATVSYLEGIA
ncbi:MAG TPA: hypothetical protein VG733_13765 [Chthoniobacteraceae bacterium]|nr:hypothetical protein [Chthoniobacteraceae bacterium]